MRCPFCSADDTKVIDSRPAEDGSAIRRRRQCDACGKRFTTYEKVETIPLIVIKKDKNRETYDRSKIESGVIKSCHKRPVSAEAVTKCIDDIENTIFNMEVREIESTTIGEIVMDKIKDLDQVAYVRFASVYREFKDVNTFMDELGKLLTSNSDRSRKNIMMPGTIVLPMLSERKMRSCAAVMTENRRERLENPSWRLSREMRWLIYV